MATYTEECFEAAKTISSIVASIDRYVVDPTAQNHDTVVQRVAQLPQAIQKYAQSINGNGNHAGNGGPG